MLNAEALDCIAFELDVTNSKICFIHNDWSNIYFKYVLIRDKSIKAIKKYVFVEKDTFEKEKTKRYYTDKENCKDFVHMLSA